MQCAALSRFDNVFMLMLGPNPAYLTYDFIEEVPEVCRINHEMAQVVRYPSAPPFSDKSRMPFLSLAVVVTDGGACLGVPRRAL